VRSEALFPEASTAGGNSPSPARSAPPAETRHRRSSTDGGSTDADELGLAAAALRASIGAPPALVRTAAARSGTAAASAAAAATGAASAGAGGAGAGASMSRRLSADAAPARSWSPLPRRGTVGAPLLAAGEHCNLPYISVE
jgi:hypothetical protein